MGIFDFLGGNQNIRDAKGVDINKEDYKIKDADKLFGQTQEQYQQNAQRTQDLRGRTDTLLNQLTGQAAGTAPSITEQQLKQAQERNLAQQLAAVQANRGGNTAALQREALRAQSAGAANIAQQAAGMRLQEQQGAQQQLGQLLGQEQAQVANLTQQYLNQGFSIRDAEQKALAEYNRLNVEQNLGIEGLNAQADARRQSGFQSGLGMVTNAVGSLGSFGATGGFSGLLGGAKAASSAQPAGYAQSQNIIAKNLTSGRGGM